MLTASKTVGSLTLRFVLHVCIGYLGAFPGGQSIVLALLHMN